MLSFGIASALISVFIAGNVPASTVPAVWNDDCIRVSHAAEVVSQDKGLCYLQTEDSNVWGVYGTLDASRLYAVMFDTQGTAKVEDDRVLLAVAMD